MVFFLIVFTTDIAVGNGKKYTPGEYWGCIAFTEEGPVLSFATSHMGEMCFLTQIYKVEFYLNSVQNKYKILRIDIDNLSDRTLELSSDKDKFELWVDTNHGRTKVEGILDLSSKDQNLWDSISQDIRELLVYPERVSKGESENIFVFIPLPELKELPLEFFYKIDSLSQRYKDKGLFERYSGIPLLEARMYIPAE
jgi:hypothetical protein